MTYHRSSKMRPNFRSSGPPSAAADHGRGQTAPCLTILSAFLSTLFVLFVVQIRLVGDTAF